MTQASRFGRHPTDGDLVRFLDRELSDVEAQRVRRHLASCASCETRISALRTQTLQAADHLSGLARNAVPDEMTRYRARAAVRAAAARASRTRPLRRAGVAVAAVLVVATLAVPPVRAWVLDRMTSAGIPESATPPVAELPAASAVRPGPPVAFTVGGPNFRVELEHAQAAGEVVLRGTDADRATAQIVSSGEESILVLPEGLRIQNGPASRATYRVMVPAGQQSVAVVVGGDTVFALDGVAVGSPRWVQKVPLRRGANSPR